MEKNKTAKYLKYAIGEIVLLVIGILIALWLNHQRQEVLNQEQECFYLTKLLDNLNEDKAEMNYIINSQEQRKNVRKEFYRIIKEKPINKNKVDSIYNIVTSFNLTFFANPSAFNSIKSSGNFGLIKNKQLQIKLSNLYEKIYYRIDYNGSLYDQRIEMTSSSVLPYFDYETKSFSDFSIIKNNQLKNIIAFEQDYNIFYSSLLEKGILEVNSIIEIINSEINRCNK